MPFQWVKSCYFRGGLYALDLGGWVGGLLYFQALLGASKVGKGSECMLGVGKRCELVLSASLIRNWCHFSGSSRVILEGDYVHWIWEAG